MSFFRISLFLLFGFGILWNPDFGIFTFITLLATIVFIDFDTTKLLQSTLNAIIQLIIALISVFIAFVIYKTIISVFMGRIQILH